MSWNTKPQRATMPPPYHNVQPAFSLQYAVNQFSITSPSSFPCSTSNQEGFSYLSNLHTNSHTALPQMSSLGGPLQIPASNLPNRTVVASQAPAERAAHADAKGSTQPSHNLQVVSGIMQNPRLSSSLMSSMPSHAKAVVSHQTHFGTNPANSHMMQGQHQASDSCPGQLQVTSNSARVPGALRGSQELQQPLPNQQLDWPLQHAPDELTFSDHRPLPKQHSYSALSFVPDPGVLKSMLMSTAPSQVTYSQLPASAQSTQAAALSCPYAPQTSTRLPPQYCSYRIQPLPDVPHTIKQMSVDVTQSPETVSSEVKKDLCQGFQQQWKSTNESVTTLGNVCDIKGDASVQQTFSEPPRTVDGAQALPQSSQEKRVDSCNSTSRPGLDTVVTKEKLARDIRSLIEMKKKFSQLARKIKINNALLKAAGCRPVSSLSGEPAQHTESAAKELSPKSHCSMELVKTCLSLWKDKPSKTTEEKASETAGGKQANKLVTSASAGVSKPLVVSVQNSCSVEKNPQNKTVSPSQAATLSMLVQNYEPLCTNVTKGSELQIAVVSPLILSNVINKITPGTLPETVYPVIKEGSICSLQNQPAEHAVVATALNVDIIAPVGNPASARVFPVVQKEKQQEPCNANSQDMPGAQEEQGCHHLSGLQTRPKPNDGTLISSDLLQIENICSLVEGDRSYNSSIAKMFQSSPLKNVEPPKLDVPGQQVFHSEHHEKQVEQGAENRGDKSMQCADLACAVATEKKEPVKELSGSSSVKPVEPRIPVGSNPERPPMNVGTPKGTLCCPTAEPDINLGDMDTSGSDPAQLATASESLDHTAFCLQDQLSELLKEFPYGVEGLNPYESFGGQKKTKQVSEDKTEGKVRLDDQRSTGHIKITILTSEQMKELFPEQDEPQNVDVLQSPKVDKLAELQREKQVAEVGSQCEPQTPAGTVSPGFEENTDQIHCCALGWLAMIYEGVPKCRCNTEEVASKEAGQGQAVLGSHSCHQGQQTSDADVAIIEFDGGPPNPSIPLAADAAAEKRQSPKIQGSVLKDASKTRKDSAPRSPELPDQLPPKCKGSDKKDTAEAKQEALANTEQEGTGRLPSKADRPESSERLKGVKLKFHIVNFQPGSKRSSDQASQKGPQKKHTVQRPNPSKPKVGLPPDSYRKNGSLCPEKKKIKLKESSPQEGHLEKRKLEQGEVPSLEIKKKRNNEQQNKNVGVTPKSCATLPNPHERGITKEDSTSNAKFSDFRHTRERSMVRVKTVSQVPSMDAKDPRERASITEQAASQVQVCDFRDPRERATVRDRVAPQMQSLEAMDTRERATVREKIFPQMPSLDVKHTRERASVKEQMAPQASDLKDARGRATVRDKTASQVQSLDAKDARERATVRDKMAPQMQDATEARQRATVRDKAALQVQSLDAKDPRGRAIVRDKMAPQMQDATEARQRAAVRDKAALQVQSLDAKDPRGRATVRDKMAPQMQDATEARQRATVKEQPASHIQALNAKDGSSNPKKVITVQEYLQRKKQSTEVAHTAKKICLGNVSGNSASTGPTRLHAQLESCRQLNGKGGGSIETSNICTSRGKGLKAHLSEASEACKLPYVEGRLDGKQPTKTESDKALSKLGSEMPPQLKEQRKSYLNQVSFRCTEREQICLTALNSSSRKVGGDDKSQAHKPKASFPGQSSAGKPGLLEFKLCPDVLLQNRNSVEDKSDVKAHPEEQVAVQVSGIKSSRKDWIQCVTEKKSMQEADQEIGLNSRLLQRSASADGRELLQQNVVKDSKATFQTYKQLYLQKRGHSLGSSPGP